MSFWDKIQQDLNWSKMQKDIRKNIEEGLAMVKEGGSTVTQKIEQFTEEGKKKYRLFNLNMKVQEEFTKLGGQIYDLIAKKSKNPLGNRKVASLIKKINKLEAQIQKFEKINTGKPKRPARRKRTVKSGAKRRATS